MVIDAGLPDESRLQSLPQGSDLIDLTPGPTAPQAGATLWDPNFGIFNCSITSSSSHDQVKSKRYTAIGRDVPYEELTL